MAGGGFNKYAAGKKRYGSGLLDAPNVGPSDKTGYRVRDAKNRARISASNDITETVNPGASPLLAGKNKRNIALKKMKAGQRGAYASSDWSGK